MTDPNEMQASDDVAYVTLLENTEAFERGSIKEPSSAVFMLGTKYSESMGDKNADLHHLDYQGKK